ncbi:MAG TPA: hypothetical protein VK738_02745 [Terriglobales bacterium]|nr:hypothetical protein [Terriglobales bacterium]
MKKVLGIFLDSAEKSCGWREALPFQLFELPGKGKGLTAEGAEERRGFKQFFKECLAMANEVSQNQGFLESAA